MEVWVAVRHFSLNPFSGTFLIVVPVVLLHSVEMFVVCLFVGFFLTVSSTCLYEYCLIFFAYPSIDVCTCFAVSL